MCVSKFRGGLGFKNLHIFNLALLAKQGWKILHNTDYLLHQIFKAKYFPKTNFFEANLGLNPSYAWCGIWEANKWLRKRCRWQIGDGSSIRLWLDPWVPGHNSLETFYQGSEVGIQDIKIKSLIHNGQWNIGLIRSLFNPWIRGEILKIQLDSTVQKDR